MTWLDRYLQQRRIDQARPWLVDGARVLDVGAADGALFEAVPSLGAGCIGLDPTLSEPRVEPRFTLVKGLFPDDVPEAAPFDAITMLAVLEHFPAAILDGVADGCRRVLRPGGRLIITVPSPRVDQVLAVLKALRLVHGMALEEHHGYDVAETPSIFGPPAFRLVRHRRFQLGLNHLFVFERTEAA